MTVSCVVLIAGAVSETLCVSLLVGDEV